MPSPTEEGLRRLAELGGESPYQDAASYDRSYRRRTQDVAFYAERAVGRVLELGAGTGRVTQALLPRAHAVVAVERSAEMLARAASRRGAHPAADRWRLVHADLRHLDLGEAFDTVLAPFNVWQHLLDDEALEQGFATAARHLAPGGCFWFDVRFPDPVELSRPQGRVYRLRRGQTEAWFYDALRQVSIVVHQAGERSTVLSHRQLFPAELRYRARVAGFRELAAFGDFDGSPLGAESPSIVLGLTR
jgi:SAM-dependent methyltransferase